MGQGLLAKLVIVPDEIQQADLPWAGSGPAVSASGPSASRVWRPASSRIRMPSSTALSYLEPAFSPATTKLVFLETEDETLPPAARTAATMRPRPGSVPVITT